MGKHGYRCNTSGIAYQYAREAFGDVSYLKLGMIYPLPDKLIKEFSEKVKVLYVIEELEPFFEEHIRKLGIKVIGKDLLPVTGNTVPTLSGKKYLENKSAERKLRESRFRSDLL